MKTSTLLRTSLLAAALGAALSAHAVNIFLVSVGSVDSPAGVTTANESVVSQRGGYGPLQSLTYSINSFSGGNAFGTGTYAGSGGTLDFSFTYPVANVITVQSGGAVSTTVDASWTATGGTLTYLSATGAGTMDINFQGTTLPADSGTLFSGSVEAVPEPSALAALGLGAVGLLRRRKRA